MRALAEALRFFSVIPLPGKPSKRASLVLVAYPWAGLILGCIVAGLGWASGWLFGSLGMAVVMLTTRILITGALHLDGLADLADGMGADNKERRLAVMADSRLGTFGALALLFVFAWQALLISELISGRGNFHDGAHAPPELTQFYPLLLAPVLSRGLLALPIRCFHSARPGGMGNRIRSSATWPAVLASLSATLLLAFLFYAAIGLGITLLVAGGMMLAAFGVSRRLGGLTGDVYGALIELGELMLFLALLLAERVGLTP